MSVTIERISEVLNHLNLKHSLRSDYVLVEFYDDPDQVSYRNETGEALLSTCIKLHEQGEFLSIIANRCWNISKCSNKNKLFAELIKIQSEFKMVRFESNGEILIPNVEIPLENNNLTPEQLQRLLFCVCSVVRKYDEKISEIIKD